MKNNQKDFFSLMQNCDKIIDKYDLNSPDTNIEQAKLVLSAINRKERLVATQMLVTKQASINLNKQDFGFVYSAN